MKRTDKTDIESSKIQMCGLFDNESIAEVNNFFGDQNLPNFSRSDTKTNRQLNPKPSFDETHNVIVESDNLLLEKNSAHDQIESDLIISSK